MFSTRGLHLPCLWGPGCTAWACAGQCCHRSCITSLNRWRSCHRFPLLSSLSIGDHEAGCFFSISVWSLLRPVSYNLWPETFLRKFTFVKHEGDDMLSFSSTRLCSWFLPSWKYDLHTGHTTLLPAFQISISSNMGYSSPSVVSQKKQRLLRHSQLFFCCACKSLPNLLDAWNCKAICVSKVESPLEK